MNIVLWIVQIFLALLFISAGGQKLIQSREAMIQGGFTGYAADYSPGFLRMLGILELLGGIGVVLPWAIGRWPILTPLAAVGLAIIMLGATNVRLKRSEQQMAIGTVVFFLMAAFVAYGRFFLEV